MEVLKNGRVIPELTELQKRHIDTHSKQSPSAIAQYLGIPENRIIKYKKLKQMFTTKPAA